MSKFIDVLFPKEVAERMVILNHGRIDQAQLVDLSTMGAKLLAAGYQAHIEERTPSFDDGVLLHIPHKFTPLFTEAANSSRDMPEMPLAAQGCINAALELLAQADRVGLEPRAIDLHDGSMLFLAQGEIPRIINM
jgi:hypothetical protein